jgi:hypothetical protein
VVQIALGALTVLSMREAYITTAHVIGGALLLAVTFGPDLLELSSGRGSHGRDGFSG